MKKSMKKFCKHFSGTLSLMLLSLAALAQTAISGKVIDSKTGMPVSGVTITAAGSKVATQSGNDGSYKLTVPAGSSSLIFSSIGFARQEVAINGRSSFEISLVQNNQQLNEVVVVGYGSQKKKDVTGSIARVSAEKIADVPAPSFESALAGKAAGVQVMTSNGLAGSAAKITIRGTSTISTQGDPLYVIDGLPINIEGGILGGPTRNSLAQDRNPLSNINPNDIESVEILKDAAAAGIYGSRGANGVILITTKKGKGKGKITFTSRVGISTPAVKPKFVDKNTWLAIRQEAWENDGHTGPQQELPGVPGGFPLNQALNSPGTDWWDQATRTGVSQDYNLSYTKGNKYYSAYIGGTYSKQKSYAEGNDFTRLGLTGNFDIKRIKNLVINLKGSLNQGTNNLVNNAWNGGLGSAMSTSLPYYPVYNPDGTYWGVLNGYKTTWDNGGNNLVAQRQFNKYRSLDGRKLVGGTVSYNFLKNFTASTTASYEASQNTYNAYNIYLLPRTTTSLATMGKGGFGYENESKYTSFNWNATAAYNKTFKNLKLTFLLGAEYQEQETLNRNYGTDTVMNPIYNGGKNYKYESNRYNAKWNTSFNKLYQSYFSRLNLTYLGRYNFQASVRRDQSSVFRENNKVAYFPTASVGWTISDEGFMQNQNLFNFLKLRAGWGQSGNDRIPWDASYSRFDTSRGAGGNYNNNPSIYRSSLGNPDLKWETSTSWDFALEYGLFKNRINGEISVYRKNSKDILLNVPQSFYIGVGDNQWQNQGEILNEGIEFSVNTINVKKKDFTWSTNFNIAHNYNEVVSIGNLLPDAIGGGTNETRIVPGNPVGTIYTVRYLGVDPADGLPVYLDKNGYTTKVLNVDSKTGDKVPVASVVPDFIGGLTNTFKYKNIELNSLFTFTYGGNIWDNSGKRNMGYITDWQIYDFYAGNYWRQPGDIAKYPKPTIAGYPGVAGNPWDNNTSIQVHDATFARLKELTLAYYLPSKLATRWKMSSAKVYFTAYNLFLFTKYPVGDPEGGRDGEDETARNQSPNANFLNAPQAKSFNLGINLSF